VKQAARETGEMLKRVGAPAPLSWVEQANNEIAELQAAAVADPKAFFGNRVRGMGEGLTRVKALLYASKNIDAALVQLNRVL
jgi:hypothetical protein